MKKSEFNNNFKTNVLPVVIDFCEKGGFIDKSARRMAYNDTLDNFHKNGLITENQASNWCIPKHLENKK